MGIQYIERTTGEQREEKIYGHKALSLLYGDGWWSQLIAFWLLPLLAHLPLFSKLYGLWQKRSASRAKIGPFIRAYGIDASEFLETDFRSFNDFFIRKLKPQRRPIDPNPHSLAAPADGRYFVYPTFDRFVAKGQEFSLLEFLQNLADSHRYAEGAMAIARLCPSDYHRFHFPCDGVPFASRLINGPLYSVNPIALCKRPSILTENKRVVTEFMTEEFGQILYVEIGATAVGSIRQTFMPQQKVSKGEEKGYFEFGGSCIVLLFEKGHMIFDADLIRNTERGLETRLNYGSSLGQCKAALH